MSEPSTLSVDIANIDSQLGALWEQQQSARPAVSRTVLMTLYVACQKPETAGIVSASIAAIASDHPARAVIVTNTPTRESSGISARTSVSCQLVSRSDAVHCSEQIFIEAHGADSAKIGGAVQPLSLPDVPLVIWIADGPAPQDEIFDQFVASCDCVLIDSDKSGDVDSVFRWTLEAAQPPGPVVVDLGWVEMAQRRLAVAQHFDAERWRGLLPSVDRIEIRFAPTDGQGITARALLFAGWITSRLQWRGFAPADGPAEAVSISAGDGRRLDFVYASGSDTGVHAVRLYAGEKAVFETVFAADRSEAILTAQEEGVGSSVRTSYLKPLLPYQILCGALEITRQDQVYFQSLRLASEILEVLQTPTPS